MLLDPFSEHLKVKTKSELLAHGQGYSDIHHIRIGEHNGVHMHHYSVTIAGMEGRPDYWQISLANKKHPNGETTSLLGFARNGDIAGESGEFAASGSNFIRHVLPRILAHHKKTLSESGRNLTALTMGAEDVRPGMESKKQKVYRTMFSGFDEDNSTQAKTTSDEFKDMFGRPKEMQMMSFRIPRHLAVI